MFVTYLLTLFMVISSIYNNLYRNIVNIVYAFKYTNHMTCEQIASIVNGEDQYIKFLEDLSIVC